MTDLNLTREEQFIINCLRSEFGNEDGHAIAWSDLHAMNWDMVYKRSAGWSVVPMLYTILKKKSVFSETAKIPEHILQKIQLKYFMSHVAYDTLCRSLTEILEVFHKAGIKVILLKGIYLAQFVYRDAGVRPMSDIDIMVKKDDLQKAESLLLHLGYSNEKEGEEITTWHHLPAFFHPKTKVKLELHWAIQHLFWRYRIDLDGIWERAHVIPMHGIDRYVFSLEDLLLHISLHATYHHKLRDMGLIPYCDMATIIGHHKHEIDWDKLQARAHEWGMAKYLHLSLCLAGDIIGASVPDHIVSAFRTAPLNKNVISDAWKRVLSVPAQNIPDSDISYPFSDCFCQSDNIMKKMRFALKMIFIPRKALAALYSLPDNSPYLFLYYGIRFFSLPYRYIRYYAKLSCYRLTRTKGQLFRSDLDTWLMLSEKN